MQFKQLFTVLIFIVFSVPASLSADQSEPLQWRGEWIQGGLLIGSLADGYYIEHQSKAIKTTSEGYFLFGLGRDEKSPVLLVLVAPDGRRTTHSYNVAGREYQIQRVDGVPQKTVTPPEEQLQRIRRESALVRTARSEQSESAWYLRGFVRPLDGPITGVYGSQRYYNGIPKSPHYGLDYAASTGTLVGAPAPGKVMLVHRDMFYSGGTLIVDHGYGLFSTFLHLSEILVEEGDQVEQGQSIAKVGSTGRATGPHLDWRMNWRETRIDPALVLKYFPANDS